MSLAVERPVRRRLAREIAEVLCVLTVINGAWLCVFARLAAFAPSAFLANTLDLINTALVPILIVMGLATLLGLALHRVLGMTLVAITAAVAIWQAAAVLAGTAPRDTVTGMPLRVVSVNAFHDNPDPARLRAVIEGAAPDIVLIEEGDGSAGAMVMRTLPRFHRVVSCAKPPCSLTILSRWPARRVPTPLPGERDLPDLLMAQVALPAAVGRVAAIDVVAVHLPRGYRAAAVQYRDMLIRVLTRHRIEPVILAGDFNLPTATAGLTHITTTTGLRRADRWIATYPANTALPAFAAIDHMFVDPAIGVRTCRRLPSTASDHFGIVCDLAISGSQGERPR